MASRATERRHNSGGTRPPAPGDLDYRNYLAADRVADQSAIFAATRGGTNEVVTEMDNRDDRAARHGGWGRTRTAPGRSRRSDAQYARGDRRDERGGDEPTWTQNAPEDRTTKTPDRDRPSGRAIARDRWLDSRGRAGASARRASKDPAKGRGTKRKSWRVPAIVIGVVVCLLAAGTPGAADAYGRYPHLHNLASDGTHHLRVVQGLLQGKNLLTQLTSPTTLPTLTAELVAARADFHQLRGELGAPEGALGIAAHLPRLGDTISTAATLAAAADEACQAGLILTDAAKPAVAWLKAGLFAQTVP